MAMLRIHSSLVRDSIEETLPKMEHRDGRSGRGDDEAMSSIESVHRKQVCVLKHVTFYSHI
jgi:hypothetical protein